MKHNPTPEELKNSKDKHTDEASRIIEKKNVATPIIEQKSATDQTQSKWKNAAIEPRSETHIKGSFVSREFEREVQKPRNWQARQSTSRGTVICFVLTLLLTGLYLFLGNRIATRNMPTFSVAMSGMQKAQVVSIVSRHAQSSTYKFEDGSQKGNTEYETLFKAKLLSGDDKGSLVEGRQSIVSLRDEQVSQVKVGDLVYLSDPRAMAAPSGRNAAAPNGTSAANTDNSVASGRAPSQPSPPSAIAGVNSAPAPPRAVNDSPWPMFAYYRLDAIIYLAAALALFIIALGGIRKGFGTLISVTYTVLSIFLVLIPAILSGINVYPLTIWTLVSIIVVTVLMVNGPNVKSLSAACGCAAGMAIAAALVLLMSCILHLTGIRNEYASYLIILNKKAAIDLRAVTFASILIGATGAVLDVAVDLSAALKELSQTTEGRSFGRLFKSGIFIGRDIMGTMVNTLVLAYVGGALTGLLMMTALNRSTIGYLLNSEEIIIEMLQMLIGAFGVLACVPMTSLIASLLFSQRAKREDARAAA